MMTLESRLSPPRHPWEIDLRHASWMLDVMCAHQFERGLEIGAYDGYSTQVFIEAHKLGHFKEVHVCDTFMRPRLAKVLEQNPFIHYHQTRSTRLLRKWGVQYDFVFVDGDHSLPTVQGEVSRLVRQKPLPLVIFAHDTNAIAIGLRGNEGPSYLKYAYQAHPAYYTLEESLKRDSEQTHRGMFFATTSLELYKVAKLSLAKWGPP